MLFGEMEGSQLSIDDLVDPNINKSQLKDRLILWIQQISISWNWEENVKIYKNAYGSVIIHRKE